MTWPTKTDFVDGDVLTAAQVNNIGTNLNEADPTGITDGYVLTADGAGGMGWEAVSGGGMTLLGTGSLSNVISGTVSGLDFTGYRLAYINYYTSDSNDNANLGMRLNGLSTNIYTYAYGYDSSQQGSEDTNVGRISHTWYSTVQGGVWIDMRTSGPYRTASWWSYTNRRSNADDRPWSSWGTFAMENTSAITSITILKPSGLFTNNAAHTFQVYGVK